jgi:hypothetical protein
MTYTIRVELQGARDYIPLHDAMRKRHFRRVIKRVDGKSFTLPTGQYRYSGDASIDAIVKSIRKATTSVNYDDASIFVSKVNGPSRFSKLKEDVSIR